MIQIIQQIDMNLLRNIHDIAQNSFLDKVMPMITLLGNHGMVWIVISVVLIISKKYRKTGIMLMAALLVSTILGEGLLKHLIQRPRPFLQVPEIKLLITEPLSYSFPSGHTATAFAAAGVIMKLMKEYSIPAVILAVLIAFSRLYLFVHYPSDILAGIVLGLISTRITLLLPVDTLLQSKEKIKDL